MPMLRGIGTVAFAPPNFQQMNQSLRQSQNQPSQKQSVVIGPTQSRPQVNFDPSQLLIAQKPPTQGQGGPSINPRVELAPPTANPVESQENTTTTTETTESNVQTGGSAAAAGSSDTNESDGSTMTTVSTKPGQLPKAPINIERVAAIVAVGGVLAVVAYFATKKKR